jgi:hypothetical protein
MNLQPNVQADAALNLSKIRHTADPILLELWEIKRQINQQANFDVALLAKQANAFDVQAAMQKLNRTIAH